MDQDPGFLKSGSGSVKNPGSIRIRNTVSRYCLIHVQQLMFFSFTLRVIYKLKQPEKLKLKRVCSTLSNFQYKICLKEEGFSFF